MERRRPKCIAAKKLEEAKFLRVSEIILSIRQTALIVEMEGRSGVFECLYRPEKGVILTLDTRIPRPQELYRDVAYHRVDKLLGWNISVPVVPWIFDESDQGVIRPYWRDVGKMEIFHFTRDRLLKNAGFWLRAAVLDYICGVVDRVSNDTLLVNGNPLLVDSGLSFVPELKFVYQSSLIRKTLHGEKLGGDLLEELTALDANELVQELNGLTDRQGVDWVFRRASKVAHTGVVV